MKYLTIINYNGEAEVKGGLSDTRAATVATSIGITFSTPATQFSGAIQLIGPRRMSTTHRAVIKILDHPDQTMIGLNCTMGIRDLFKILTTKGVTANGVVEGNFEWCNSGGKAAIRAR